MDGVYGKRLTLLAKKSPLTGDGDSIKVGTAADATAFGQYAIPSGGDQTISIPSIAKGTAVVIVNGNESGNFTQWNCTGAALADDGATTATISFTMTDHASVEAQY